MAEPQCYCGQQGSRGIKVNAVWIDRSQKMAWIAEHRANENQELTCYINKRSDGGEGICTYPDPLDR